jgi:hypothetical protein
MNKRVALAVAMGVLALLPSVVLAEGTSCGLPTYVIPDGRIVTSTIPAGTTYYLYYLNNGAATGTRSYSLEVRNSTNIWNQGFTVTAFSDIGVCASVLTTTDTTTNDPEQHSSSGKRLSFLHNNPGVEFSIANTSGVPLTYEFSIVETTMFGAAWSTISNYNTYYAFANTTGVMITGTLTLTTTTGAAAGSTPITISANNAAFTNTVALATPRGVTGVARFTHNGPPGSVLIEADVADFTLTPPYIQPVKFQALRDSR